MTMAESLEERLLSHARAFDGLLSLIPAKYYYGEDTSDQWQRKKQTKEQARNAKLAKLDPDSSKSAKDVMDENARKRKRDDGEEEEEEEEENGESESEVSELGAELPREGLKRGELAPKKQKKETSNPAADSTIDTEADERKKEKAEKKAAKQERKKQKLAEKLERRKQKESTKAQPQEAEKEQKPEKITPTSHQEPADEPANDDGADEVGGRAEEMVPMEGFVSHPSDSTSPSSPAHSQTFGSSHVPSVSSSISSDVAAEAIPDPAESKKDETNPEEPKPLKPSQEELKQRLQKRLEELRAARHADGLDGKPARNRQELIEARRRREEQRRQHKKELRQKAKEEEQRLRDEAIARRFSPRGSLLASPGSPAESIASITNNFSFGRVMFADGQLADPSLTGLRDPKKQRGRQDPVTALKAAEAKQARLESLPEEKRTDIEEKDMWLNAKKRAHGEKVKDDISLLKKSLNRKQTAKKKSEVQWKERVDGVAKGKAMRQTKREDNLRKRREEKGGKGKKNGKGKARPGFEGSFVAKKK